VSEGFLLPNAAVVKHVAGKYFGKGAYDKHPAYGNPMLAGSELTRLAPCKKCPHPLGSV
jgi:hypothetical protein